MSSFIFGGSLNRCRLKIVFIALWLVMASALGFGVIVTAWAQEKAQDESGLKLEAQEVTTESGSKRLGAENSATPLKPLYPGKWPTEKTRVKTECRFNMFKDIKPDAPEQEPIFDVLNQRLRQNMDFYTCEAQTFSDPFLPPEKFRGKFENLETDDRGRMMPDCHRPLNQWRLVAISVTHDGSSPLASFEDSLGISYIFRTGDQIGRRQGRIVKITSSTVMIEETIKNFMGEDKKRITELKLYLP